MNTTKLVFFVVMLNLVVALALMASESTEKGAIAGVVSQSINVDTNQTKTVRDQILSGELVKATDPNSQAPVENSMGTSTLDFLLKTIALAFVSTEILTLSSVSSAITGESFIISLLGFIIGIIGTMLNMALGLRIYDKFFTKKQD